MTKRTTAKTERMSPVKTPAAAAVGSTAWVLHDDNPQGYEVDLYASEDGAYEGVLVRVQQLVDQGEIDRDDNEDLIAALDAKDGKTALAAFDEIINNDGRDGTGGVFLWVTEQKVGG